MDALWDFVSFWWYPAVFVIGVPLMLWLQSRSYAKWYDHPDTIAARNKEAYDKAHAYTGGKCCCGKD